MQCDSLNLLFLSPWQGNTFFLSFTLITSRKSKQTRTSYYRRGFDIVDPYLGALCELGTVKCGGCQRELTINDSLHLSDCQRGNGYIPRHNALRDALHQAAQWAGKSVLPDGARHAVGKDHKLPDLTVKNWQAGRLNLCLDVRVSTHTTKPFKRLYQLPDGSDTVHPARDILAPAHSARISKFKEYATPFNAARLNPGRNQSTPEEQRTLKLTTLSDSLGDVLFLPVTSSSGGGISPDVNFVLKTLASTALAKNRVIDSNPVAFFHPSSLQFRIEPWVNSSSHTL